MGLNVTFLEKRLSITPMLDFVQGQRLLSRGETFRTAEEV